MRTTFLALALLVSCGPSLPMVRSDTSSDLPLRGLDDTWQARFDEGDRLFDVPFREADGLGPLFIRQSCGSCHDWRPAGRERCRAWCRSRPTA